MRRFWALFFIGFAILAVWFSIKAPSWNWWFPTTVNADGTSNAPLGQRIDDLFHLILYVTTVVFIGTQAGLGYVLWTGSKAPEDDLDEKGQPRKAWFSHGSHSLEVMWTIVPAVVLLFIALYQMEVWAEYRIKDHFPKEIKQGLQSIGMNPDVEVERKVGDRIVTVKLHREVIAEVTARQFEWRIRYPGVDQDGHVLPLLPTPQPTDLYAVNDLHIPSGVPALIELKTQDVQHSFFVPELRVKQDAVPGLVIPIWMQADKSANYSLTCAELCGWGHYKMKARVVAEPAEQFVEYLRTLQEEQNDDGFKAAEE
ncbi:MAG: cytochrome c oxidase subunit II [Planctomycetaceae bacterium]